MCGYYSELPLNIVLWVKRTKLNVADLAQIKMKNKINKYSTEFPGSLCTFVQSKYSMKIRQNFLNIHKEYP